MPRGLENGPIRGFPRAKTGALLGNWVPPILIPARMVTMEYRTLFITGSMLFEPDRSLAETAARLGMALGVTFAEDASGRFDEFPSFGAESAGLTFDLLGIPVPEEQFPDNPVTHYQFLIDQAFQAEAAIEECDASSYFAELIRERSDLTPILHREHKPHE